MTQASHGHWSTGGKALDVLVRDLSVGRKAAEWRTETEDRRLRLRQAESVDPCGDHAALRAAVREASDELGRWEAGTHGEMLVAAVLTGLRQGVLLLDRLAAADGTGNIDHLVIGPYGVFVIDAKNWAGHLLVGPRSLRQQRSGGGPIRPRTRDLYAIRALADRVTENLGYPAKPVIGLAGTADGIDVPIVVGGVCLVPGEQLDGWINRHPDRLNDNRWRTLHHRATRAFPPAIEDRADLTYWASPKMHAEQDPSGELHFVAKRHRLPEVPSSTDELRTGPPSGPPAYAALLREGSAATAHPRSQKRHGSARRARREQRSGRGDRLFGIVFGAACWTTIALTVAPTRHLLEWLLRLLTG